MNATIKVTTLNPSLQAAGRARKVFLPSLKPQGEGEKFNNWRFS